MTSFHCPSSGLTPNTLEWSLVFAAAGTENTEGRNALERLCEAYWYPLYAYVRRRGYSCEDACDLTQSYFAKLLEKNYIRQVDRKRGRFRSFLLTSMKNFLANEWDRAHRQKRGGEYQFVSWDQTMAENRYRQDSTAELSPDALYDRSWVYSLLETVMRRLEEEHRIAGKETLFQKLRVYLTGQEEGLRYREVAAELGMSLSNVKMTVQRLRERFGQLLRAEIAETVVTPEEVDDEMRYLASLL